MPIIQENPTYFSDKSAAAASTLNTQKSIQRQQQPRCGISTFGARRKVSVTSYEDVEDGSEMETFLSSYESNNSYNGSEINPDPSSSSSRGLVRSSSHKACNSNTYNTTNGYTHGSLKRNRNKYSPNTASAANNEQNHQSKLSGMSSLTRLGQLFKKSKSKSSVGSDSHASTIESSGIGSPTCTPDSSLSIYTNSLDGDSHSSNNSNQISPKHLEESMENRFCSTYTFDDCGIFAANMYYNVGESSVFTIYHQHNNSHANQGNNSGGRTIPTSSQGTSAGEGAAYSVTGHDDEFEDCVQPYYNNTTFSTFPNPKRCSVASAASTTTSSVVPVPLSLVNENENLSSCITGKPTTTMGPQTYPLQHDRDGYLRPNEPRNMRNVKNLYINGSVIANANGQVQQVQVDVHTPTSPLSNSATNQNGNNLLFSESNNSGSGGFNSSAASSSGANGSSRYHFDSAGSTTSAATTLLAGGSNNFLCGLPEDDTIDGMNKSNSYSRNGQLPVYMNRAYFGSNSILPTTNRSLSLGALHHSELQHQHHQRVSSTSVSADCEPYCSLCASSIMGSPRQRSKMDVAIVKCKECFFSREAESHIRGFFDKLMTEDKQKMDVTLKSYDLKDLDHPTDRVVVHSAKVQIVIISHHFLQRLKDEASRRPRLSPINRVFRSKNVIAILLAVTAREVTDGYESVLPRFREWFSVDLRSTNKYDQEFCKKFTEQVIRIYNVELSNSSNFSVFPKKVTREQPKIAIVFKKPIEPTDEVRVELKTAKQANIVISHVKLENPHTTLLRIPDTLSPDREAIVDVSVFVNNNKIGGSRIKSELNMKRFDEDDVDRMAKLLPPFLDWLDKHIAEKLMKHYKECTDYTADPELELMNGIIICKADILPTIMHFSAYYGLRKTAFVVLEEADGLPHCNIRNELDETPADIASARGNTQICQLIGDYQEISNSYKAYRYIKEIVEKNTGTVDGEDSQFADKLENNTEQLLDGYEDLLPQEEGPMKPFDENNENSNSEDISNFKISPEVTTHSSASEAESATKSSDEEPTEPPTPHRRAKIGQTSHRRQYVNVNGNPADNPEAVQQREKKNYMKSPLLAEKRLSIIRPNCPNYDVPRLESNDYKVPPPELRPVEERNESGTSNPVFKPKNTTHFITASGYLIMNDGAADGKEKTGDEANSSTPVTMKPEKPLRNVSPQLPPSNTTGNEPTTTSRTDLGKLMDTRASSRNNDTVPLDAADEQLIELLNDFKNNTYDMKMVEILFENWKQRPDVQRSIELKMEMLDKLREEYRTLQQRKEPKSKSVLDKIKTSFTIRRKKSTMQPFPVKSVSPSRPVDTSTNNCGVTSPTALTFTGPYLPSQAVPLTNPTTPPVQNLHVTEQYRVSDWSYRTSIDSRASDSSVESEKPTNETSTNNKPAAPIPPEYTNPISKRFIPSYVSPNPPTEENSASEPTPIAGGSFGESYQVPPPPRPVKPGKKLPTDDQRVPPIVSRAPPEIPEELAPALPPSMSRIPPSVPAKPTPKYLGTEPSSPTPVPPPRTNNPPNMFSYIDYKRKNQEANEISPAKMSYENMKEDEEGKST